MTTARTSSSLLDIIRSGSWNSALFTTYSISLTFFESIILRQLRQSGCREIWVVVDVDGYRSSLMERRSYGVGQEYHLIPLSLARGVFHPKCSHLAGESRDVLAIGSGNLTFGGFGRNLEVLDVLTSSDNASCFHEFSDLLASIKRRPDIKCPNLSWVDLFANRALEMAGRGRQEDSLTPKLIHSVDTPITEQLATRFKGQAVKDLTVLSPFHDATGMALLTLAKATGARSIRVALPPAGESCSFPFSAASRWPIPVSAVSLNGGQNRDERLLHAKWFEWRTDSGWLAMTGSINATRPALLTTDNVEVGVIRVDPHSRGWVKWNKARTPNHSSPRNFTAVSNDRALPIYAELSAGGQLCGTVVGNYNVDGIWKGRLDQRSGDSVTVRVEADKLGRFSELVPESEPLVYAPSLQLFLEKTEQLARGWVHNQEVLDVQRGRKLPLPSILRLLDREETDDDNIALLVLCPS